MSSPLTSVAVLGDGAMGTLCAMILAERGSQVTLWGRSSEHVARIDAKRENVRYLPGHRLTGAIRLTSDRSRPVAPGVGLVVSAIPCQFMRSVLAELGPNLPPGVPVASVAKGIEVDTLLRPTQIIRACCGDRPVACLSGPSIAPEIADRKPASVVVAATEPALAELVQRGLSTPYFRIYTSADLLGVELSGAAKNVIAIAAGICDGLGAGDNAKASLVTRGLVEITRLGVAMGASADTFRGLAGVGDLITTCISKIGRNRSAGEQIGRGATADEVIASSPSVIEGIPTTRSVLELARRHDVEMPITAAVASVLFEGRRPVEAVEELMTRPLRGEAAR
jgi:glycerol-3-phosphate dehydrogenase (NAD(P)+)